MKKLFSSLVLLLTVLLVVQAQEPVFKVEINVDSVLMGNRFQVSFTIENAQGQNCQAPSFHFEHN